MPDTPNNLPGNGFLGWLGRQIGYVAKAVQTDVTAPTQLPPPPPAPVDSKIVYRECKIEEKESPVDPNVKFRRTVIDEVVQKETSKETMNDE